MFTLTGTGIGNILFDARMRNPAQLPAQLTFCPAQFASKNAQNFHVFFPHPVRRPEIMTTPENCFSNVTNLYLTSCVKPTASI